MWEVGEAELPLHPLKPTTTGLLKHLVLFNLELVDLCWSLLVSEIASKSIIRKKHTTESHMNLRIGLSSYISITKLSG